MKHLTNQPNTSPAILVALDGTYALIDAKSERLFVLNDAAGQLWRRLSAGGAPGTDAELAFVRELARLGLLDAGTDERVCPPGSEGDEPRILATAPLQVAANTSDPNPFSEDPSW